MAASNLTTSRGSVSCEHFADLILNMSGGLRPLSLVEKQKKERASEIIDIAYCPRRLYRTIGSVTYSILPTPTSVLYVLKKEVAPIVAARLAKLGTVNEIFNLDIRANAILINEFSDAASLEEILALQEGCWFNPEHCKYLAADVLAGISALHRVGLQRNAFSKKDILLVWRANTVYFQIAGIENCTWFYSHEPTDQEERKSFIDLLSYLEARLEIPQNPWIGNLKSCLEPYPVLSHAALQVAQDYATRASRLYARKELIIYVQAVRILVTTLGGFSTS